MRTPRLVIAISAVLLISLPSQAQQLPVPEPVTDATKLVSKSLPDFKPL